MFWRFQIALTRIHFNQVEGKPSYLLIVNKNKEIQRLYSSVNKADLRKNAAQTQQESNQLQNAAIRAEDSKKRLDF